MPFITAASTLLGIAVLVGYLAITAKSPSAGIRRLLQGALAAESAGGALPRQPADRLAAARQRLAATLERFGGAMRTPDGMARRLKWAGITLQPGAWQALPYPLGLIGAVLGAAVGATLHRDILVAAVAVGGLAAMLPSIVLSVRLGARKTHIARDVLSFAEYLTMACAGKSRPS